MKQKGKSKMSGGSDYSNLLKEDFRIIGYHKKETFNQKGDLVTLEFFENFNEETKVLTDLMIKEERVYSRSGVTGLPNQRTTNITWYNNEGEVIAVKENLIKLYSSKKGLKANKRARKNIIENASMYFFSQLVANDPATSQANKNDFDNLTSSSASKYVNSNMQPIIDIITNSTDPTKPEFRTYVTASMRDALLGILNVSLI